MRWRRGRRSEALETHRVFAPLNFAMYGRAPCMEYRDGADLLYINLGVDSASYRLRDADMRALVEGQGPREETT